MSLDIKVKVFSNFKIKKNLLYERYLFENDKWCESSNT